jgi:hypothetical protein
MPVISAMPRSFLVMVVAQKDSHFLFGKQA